MSGDNNQHMDRRSLLQTVGAFGALVGLGGITSATPGREPGPKKDELIVGVDPDVSNIEAAVEPKIPSNANIVHTNETLGYAAVEIADQASIQAKESVKRTVLDADEVTYSEDNVTYEPSRRNHRNWKAIARRRRHSIPRTTRTSGVSTRHSR